MKKKDKEKKVHKRKKVPKFIAFLMLLINVLTIVLLVITFKLNVLPLKFYIPLAIVFVLFDLLVTILLKKKKKRKLGLFLSLILLISYGVAIYYECQTDGFINTVTNNDNKVIEKYMVIVNNDNKYSDIKDLKDESFGLIEINEDGYKLAISELEKKIKTNNKYYEDSYSITDALLKKEVTGFLIEESQEKILEENYENFTNKTKILYTFEIQVTEESVKKETDITKNSFNIYISGIDTYGSIKTQSRSDVNIVVSVNPTTGKIALVDIPRDYYVQIYKKNGLKDKLTHAGIYGADTSVKTIEKLLDIDINYYVKFNFTSLIKIVDKIGGVRVYSDYTFKSGLYDDNTTEEFMYYKGWNTLNGKEALSFARERHAFNDGDRVRGAHQEALIEAILDKVTSPSIIKNYTSLLDALKDTFITNMDDNNLRRFIQLQLDKNIDWKVEKMVMDGNNGSEFTYSYPRQKLYVMIPKDESLQEAKDMINKIIKGE